VKSETVPAIAFGDRNVAASWGNAHRYTPAPRHRRRLLLRIIRRLEVRDMLDAGCAQPFLVEEVVQRLGIEGHGCDISDEVMRAAEGTVPGAEFRALDLAHEIWPDNRQFDLVVCSETLEHIPDWRAALANVVQMSRRYVLITVPTGPVREVDRLMGHHQHYEARDIVSELERDGCRALEARSWGFPMHSAYRAAVERFGSDKIYESFAEGRDYTWAQKAISNLLYALFLVNDAFRRGTQLIVLAEKNDPR
jgi:SAM-dependent methyltransferase